MVCWSKPQGIECLMDAFAADDMDKKIDECIEKRPMGILMVEPMNGYHRNSRAATVERKPV